MNNYLVTIIDTDGDYDFFTIVAEDIDHARDIANTLFSKLNNKGNFMNWIKFAHRLPPDDDTEIFIRKIDASEWHQCPANECWLDVPHESKHEWEWAFWKTIKLKAKHVGWDGFDPSAPNGFD